MNGNEGALGDTKTRYAILDSRGGSGLLYITIRVIGNLLRELSSHTECSLCKY